jgi:hypothetical protein
VRTRSITRCAGLGLWLVACSPPSTTQAEGTPAPRAVAPDPEPQVCRPSLGGGAWARFEGAECAWELRDEGERLSLSSLAIDAPEPVRGEVPEPCRMHTCVYHGAWAAAGPVLLAVVPSPHSEMPSDVLLGVAHGDRLVFTSLWEGAGEPVDSDLTPVGPAHALAPFACGHQLALFAVERLDAVGLSPPASLRAREGRLDPAKLSVGVAEGPPDPIDRDSCRPLDLPVP